MILRIIALLAVCVLGAAALSGCADSAEAIRPASGANAMTADRQTSELQANDPQATNLHATDHLTTEGAHPVQITDIEVPGPAAGLDPGVPNLVGSASIPVRVYTPAGEPWAELVWAHGGSFVRGDLDWPEADGVSRGFAAAGIRVHSVDYVLASDTVHAPAPGNDVAAVLRSVTAGSDLPVVIGGASAGGHLAALAALAQAELAASGDGRAATALILEYPTLHRVQRADAAISAATAALPEQRRFRADRIAEMYTRYLGDADAPVVAGELSRQQLALMPPTVIVNADADDLRASGEEFAEQLALSGVRVIEYTQPGTVHGYMNRPEESDQARSDATQTIARFTTEIQRIVESKA